MPPTLPTGDYVAALLRHHGTHAEQALPENSAWGLIVAHLVAINCPVGKREGIIAWLQELDAERLAANLAKARELLRVKTIDPADDDLHRADADVTADAPAVHPRPCPCCGGRMLIIETFEGVCRPRSQSTAPGAKPRVDTS